MHPIAERIFGMDDRPLESVTIPEWDDMEIWFRPISAEQRLYAEDTFGKDNGADKRWLISVSACDEHGVLIFSEEDVAQLMHRNGMAVDRLFATCQAVSYLRNEDYAELKKNSLNGRASALPVA